jgi:hypothetical protein
MASIPGNLSPWHKECQRKQYWNGPELRRRPSFQDAPKMDQLKQEVPGVPVSAHAIYTCKET